jgi:hypothetical protein
MKLVEVEVYCNGDSWLSLLKILDEILEAN